MFLDSAIKWCLVYLRIFAEFIGWKRLAKGIGKFVKDEPDTSPEQHVL